MIPLLLAYEMTSRGSVSQSRTSSSLTYGVRTSQSALSVGCPRLKVPQCLTLGKDAAVTVVQVLTHVDSECQLQVRRGAVAVA